MRRARVIGAIVLIAAAAAVAAWLSPDRDDPQRAESLRVDGSPTEPGPALAALPESRDAAAANARDRGSSADTEVTSEEALTTLRVEVKVGDEIRPGVTVRARKPEETRPFKTATTDASGFVEFEDVDPSAIVVEAFAEGLRFRSWVKKWGGADGWQDEAGIVHLRLEEGISLDGRVLDSGTDLPISGASVRVYDQTGGYEVGPSDAAGKFHVGAVKNDSAAWISVRAPGYVVEQLEIRADGGKLHPAMATLRLDKAGAVVGVVHGPDGTPIPGAKVQVGRRVSWPAEMADRLQTLPLTTEVYEHDDSIYEGSAPPRDPTDPLPVLTDATGTFRVEGITFDTRYVAIASAGGFAISPPSSEIHATAGAPDPSVTLLLRRSATVTVKIAYPEGTTGPGSPRVRLFLARDREMLKPVPGDTTQGVRFEDVDPGAFVAFVQQEGFLAAVRPGIAVEGERVTISVPLQVGATVEGVVVDGEGAPLADANVAVAVAAGQGDWQTSRYLVGARRTKSGANGSFAVTGLHPGPVLLVAEHSRGDQFLATRQRLELAAPARDVRVVVLRLGVAHMRLIAPDGTPFSGNAWIADEEIPSGRSRGHERRIERGEVEQPWLDEGSWVLLVAPDSHAWIRRSFEIRDGATIDFGDVRLDPGVTISGRVVDVAGNPVVAADVSCMETRRRSTKSDADGRFSLDRFPREPVTLRISTPRFPTLKLVVEPGKTSGLEILMRRPATISGTIHAADGRVEGSAVVLLARQGEKPKPGVSYGRDDEESVGRDWAAGGTVDLYGAGQFMVTLPGGRWTVWWQEAEGKTRAIAEWTVVDGQRQTIDIDLPAK